ncbi:cytochrome-c oxidase, cbb3-type subunit III [Shumkonia mesophila]|uniref:cytochrome-c oxidase, cbb3-type subunit III n=1 Tax=Shumkonia mesophila TaxID=2838854 RepID=UPI00293507F9|nr:cytochrome-c oxidase, cbb3-type subunit III [Shumkonia mesophila]
MADRETDVLTGTETTGHEWDGIKELNTPLPKWWLYTFYATIVWAFGYFVLYPAWPSLGGFTKGMLGYSSRAEIAETMDQVTAGRAAWAEKFANTPVEEIVADRELLDFAMAGGKAIFADNCQPCHGASGSGALSYPVLADDDWLWGGAIETIYATVQHGIRSADGDTRVSEMPRFGADNTLTPKEIATVADYVLSLSGTGKAPEEGATLFADNCAACHAEDGKGMAELGAPNLTDGIWLYGGGKAAVVAQVTAPRHGVMPAWGGRLNDVSIKQVSIYVHSLGGGQ